MKTEIKLSDLLRKGTFGPVSLKDSFQIVKENLGISKDSHNPNVIISGDSLVYSRYEFFFQNGILTSFQNDHFNPKYPEYMEFKNEKIVVNPEVFKADKEKSFREVLNYLQTEGIKHSVVEYFERKVIKTVGNVIIDFDDEEWSDTENKWIKSENHLNSKLIGFRTSIHDYS